ncbi:pyruvate dehydrogenase E1 component subunit alpha, mitochondrial isoform X2 [Cryptomeria japonica]|uniref:pyruvate dehydrogenase E1 component subunit alpha, mitochondrial isoform X2 n=1 Tax=Cryptomeria japonica TaxID=3369 RepID=UPI0027DA8366|nr:pyruvate dehydrogenase E1 component subunit alpha, mitochondrial isoform X2 [Cryptomeria japonica]
MFGIFIELNKRNMMALYLAKLAYSKSTYRCLYSLRRTFSSNSANDTTPFTVETTLPFIGYRCEPPPRSVETSPKELMSFYKDMSIMRRMEITADSLYKSGLVRGFCHLYDGQEAIAVGIKEVTSQTDCVITAYRDHCIFLGRGGSLLEVFAELLGRKDGCSLGKGGSMHLYKKDNRFYGGHGIVGAHIPLGCGLAFALKYGKVDAVSITLYGDGAANQGQLYEALNMAALWNLPVVLVCENNHYGMGTAEWRAAKCSAYYKRGHYVPGLKVDGMDALAVKQAVKFGKDHALKNGPIILEMDTYRYHGHSMSDPGSTYRTRDEITTFRQERDPIERVRKLLLEKELASPDDLKNIDKEAKQMVNDAVAQAKESPTPDESQLFTHVYADGLGTQAFGVDRKHRSTILQ